jgi:2-polyprenyl-3-methyl-5-hydroxy-6-metoxy-1,4-benzoquinol methylase
VDSADAAVIGKQVLDFYRTLPFNVTGSPDAMAAEVKRNNPLSEYPPLARILTPRARVADIGCGAGWRSNSIAFHVRARVLGLDFNPDAIAFARTVAAALRTETEFEHGNLFTFRPQIPFDVVISLGVLHHTGNCAGAVRHLCRFAVKAGGFLFLGLYHQYGRRPFLEHFRAMRAKGATDEAMLAEFTRLIGNQPIDRVHLLSWFRDQVQHPHETQHTFAETADWLKAEGFEVLSTSINDYEQITTVASLAAVEKQLEGIGQERLAQGSYYPGFFSVLARRPR